MIKGVDVSHWQGRMDWDAVVRQGVGFAYIKGAEGKSVDDCLERNWRGCQERRLAHGMYFYVKPANQWQAQAECHTAIAVEFLKGDELALPVWVDCEDDGGLGKSALESWLVKYIRKLEEGISGQAAGIKPKEVVIYTRASWFDVQLPLTDWAWRKMLAVAHYGVEKPTLPKEWSNHRKTWTFWQHSADKNGLGQVYGAESTDIDLDWFNGGQVEFEKKFGVAIAPVNPPAPPPVVNVSGMRMKVVKGGQIVRTGPGDQYPALAGPVLLVEGQEVEVLDIEGVSELWVRIGEDRWAPAVWNGVRTMVKG